MRRVLTVLAAVIAATSGVAGLTGAQPADRPFLTSELIFPLEHWHNHASMVVELPGGDRSFADSMVPASGRLTTWW